MRTYHWIGAWAVMTALFAVSGVASAGKGGSGGGGKPGGGGSGTSADPAVVYVDAPDLMVMDADGGNVTVLVAGAASSASSSVCPHWSPDGQWVVFNSEASGLGGPGIYVASRDGQTVKKVASTTQLPFDPSWGPVKDASGNHLIVYSAGEPDGHDELFLLRLDADLDPVDAAPAAITDETDEYSVWDPTWAPDGRTIAALRIGGGRDLVVYTLSEAMVAGDAIVKVAHTATTWGFTPSGLDFANLSNVLVMHGSVGNDYDVFTVDLGSDADMVDAAKAAGEPFNVTDNATDDEIHPSWSPDDLQIVFVRNAPRNRDKGIEVVDADGTDQARVTQGWLSAPDWRP